MPSIFFTYVWGSHDIKGGPLTFVSSANRKVAMNKLQDGDLVFSVVSRTPFDGDVVIDEAQKGRVLGCWQISRVGADTSAYGIEAKHDWDLNEEGGYRWPVALQPIRVWKIDDAPLFVDMPGYVRAQKGGTHTQAAVTGVQQVQGRLAEALERLLTEQGHELEVMLPAHHILDFHLEKLRQRHPFRVNGYNVPPRDQSQVCSVYIATLGKHQKGAKVTLKIGHAHDPKARVAELNKYRLASEPQWNLAASQAVGTEQEAIVAEAHLGKHYDLHRTEPNNGEVFHKLNPFDVAYELSLLIRNS